MNYFRRIFADFNPQKIVVYPSQDPKGVSTGIAHVTFAKESNAVRAFDALQNKVVDNNETLLLTLTSQNQSPINCLPNECLLEIFLRLPIQDKLNIERVCRKWKALANKCWTNEKKFYVTNVNPKMNQKEFSEYIKRCGPYCKDIEIYLHKKYQIALTSENCRKLNSIKVTINYKSVTANAFNSLLQLTNELDVTRAIMEINCDTFPFSFSTLLRALPEKTTEIHISTANSCQYYTLGDFNISKFQNLRALSLHFFDFSEESLIGFDQLRNLVSLVLMNSRINLELIKTIKNFKKLEHLCIPGTEITDNILDGILSNNENLEFLNISKPRNITDYSFISLTQHQNLRVLKMTNLRHVTFRNISGFKNLRCLSCDNCLEITIDGMRKVLENSPCLQVVKADRVAAMISLMFDIELIVRKTENGKTLMPKQINEGSYMWLESELDTLKPTVSLMFPGDDFYDAWFNETTVWYNHDKIRRFH